MRIDEGLLKSLEERVQELERGSSVEVVVFLAKRAGDATAIHLLVASLFAWIGLALAVLLPYDVSDLTLLPLTALCFTLGFEVSRRWLGRRLMSAARRRGEAENAARVVFMREHVGGTRERTGVLVYLAVEDREVVILPDYGVDKALERAHWNALRDRTLQFPGDLVQGFLQASAQLGALLAERLPARPDDVNELPNRPMVEA